MQLLDPAAAGAPLRACFLSPPDSCRSSDGPRRMNFFFSDGPRSTKSSIENSARGNAASEEVSLVLRPNLNGQVDRVDKHEKGEHSQIGDHGAVAKRCSVKF